MMTLPIRYVTGSLLLVGALWTAAAAQAPSRTQPPGYIPPPAGQPDIQGVWKADSLARYDVEAHSARPGVPASRGVIVDPPDGKIPYRPEALQKRDENYKNSRDPDPWKSADPYHKCYNPGVPRITYLGWPFQIYQTPRYVLFNYEWMHLRRMAYYDMKGRKTSEEGLWNGDSRARWDGNTLVVDVTNFNGQSWFDEAGNYTSKALHVVERYTKVDDNTIDYEATIEDPTLFTRPWTIRMPLRRQTEPLYEYECHALLDDLGIPVTWPRD
jgi:hypothetical protein